ncbi:N-acetylmuramidase domain-containing protein [Aquabacterium sp.]|uniref:N-acetylmuramidase domain-containing protein n=1 Tax=Aquabacterium sp. TaxID=1872578 RepID=UPI0035C6DC18
MRDAPTPQPSDPYFVRRGDTLSGIANRCGRSTADLQRINALKDAHRLRVGQTLYLSEASAFGVSVLFLDALRHPIQNLRYRIEFDGRVRQGATDQNGLVPTVVTASHRTDIKVWVHGVDGTWQQAAQVASELGHKLVTLVSNALVTPGKTQELPRDAASVAPASPAAPTPPSVGPQAPPPGPARGTPSKNNPAVHSQRTRGARGEPIVTLTVDIPQDLLNLFGTYTGGEITENDWSNLAQELGCESAVLKAFAVVESGGRPSFWRLNQGDGAHIPALLFERHYFSRLTQGRHDASHPDISWPAPYRKKSLLGHADTAMQDGKVRPSDIYSDFASAYLRLINAHRLDADAALRACSWGKFQIMGDNFGLCGTKDAMTFVGKVCRSEAHQLSLMAAFIRKMPAPWKDPHNKKAGKGMSLWDAIKAKDWAQIAYNYNGPNYRTYHYDTKLKAAYEALKKSPA